jgi:hypothetical protein
MSRRVRLIAPIGELASAGAPPGTGTPGGAGGVGSVGGVGAWRRAGGLGTGGASCTSGNTGDGGAGLQAPDVLSGQLAAGLDLTWSDYVAGIPPINRAAQAFRKQRVRAPAQLLPLPARASVGAARWWHVHPAC